MSGQMYDKSTPEIELELEYIDNAYKSVSDIGNKSEVSENNPMETDLNPEHNINLLNSSNKNSSIIELEIEYVLTVPYFCGAIVKSTHAVNIIDRNLYTIIDSQGLDFQNHSK